jgi:2-methylisocitrate lyase-like PEP mutase family enzyme
MSVRKRFRELIARPGILLMPGAYDGLSARIIEAEGFEAIVAGGYAAIGSMLGQPDSGQSSMRDYADHYARICDAVTLPVYVDGDTGFGGVNNVRQMVRAFEAAGVAGLFIGDQVFPNRCGYMPGKQIVPVEEMVAKLKAALDARRDPDLWIAARTDAAGILGLDAAIERGRIFMAAGVDMTMVQGADLLDDYRRLRREVPGPHFANLSNANEKASVTVDAYEAAGAEAVTFPSAPLFAAAAAVTRAMAALKRDRSLSGIKELTMPLPDYYELVGLKDQLAREERYDDDAAALLRERAVGKG